MGATTNRRSSRPSLTLMSLILMKEDAPPRDPSLRKVFHGLRWVVRTGAE